MKPVLSCSLVQALREASFDAEKGTVDKYMISKADLGSTSITASVIEKKGAFPDDTPIRFAWTLEGSGFMGQVFDVPDKLKYVPFEFEAMIGDPTGDNLTDVMFTSISGSILAGKKHEKVQIPAFVNDIVWFENVEDIP